MRSQMNKIAEENARLRKLMDETVTRVDTRIDRLASSAGEEDWSATFGGSPDSREKTPPPVNPEEFDQFLEQKVEQTLQQRQQQMTQQQIEDYNDGQRFWNKFVATYPNYAQDPRVHNKLKIYWEDAKAMNARASADQKLSNDALYQYVSQRVVQQHEYDLAFEQRLAEQRQQQQQQQQAGPFKRPIPVTPAGTSSPGGGHGSYNPAAQHQTQPGSVAGPATRTPVQVSPTQNGGMAYATTSSVNSPSFRGQSSGEAHPESINDYYDSRIQYQQERLYGRNA